MRAAVLGGDAAGLERTLPVLAAIGVDAELARGGVILAELRDPPRPRRATLLASPAARRLERELRELDLRASARGHLCHLALPAGEDGVAALAGLDPGLGLLLAELPGEDWRPALEHPGLRPRAALLGVRLPEDRPLAALVAGEARRAGLPLKLVARPLPRVAARRALAGVAPGGAAAARAARLRATLLGGARPAGDRAAEAGQALPLALGAVAALALCAMALASIGGAVTGKGRGQRAADLAAVSAARSLRDDAPRLLSAPLLPDGSPDPRHLTRGAFLARARLAGVRAARRNGVAPSRVRISFPGRAALPPLRARAVVRGAIDPADLPGGERLEREGARPAAIRVVASAVAEATLSLGGWTGMPGTASGGGYSGPLAYRDGEGMRPDVAAAFDRMAAAARRSGIGLVVNSGFRSDAEQAVLFARNPDPRMVAPPGRSLHRCATELDLGPSGAYGWLAARARRFGFLKRYPWEPWHFGFVAGPAPCSAAGNSAGAAGGAGPGPDGAAAARGLPAFVPARFRAPIERSAARWGVSGALLAAQLMAESGFDPNAVSPAGAQGIAQFIPSTAAAYGLRDPFDPVAAIDAQAHLMSRLLRQFRSIPLALAAYNAGPGAVAACGCSDPYAETAAYVARILALLDGAGALLAPGLEVRLVS